MLLADAIDVCACDIYYSIVYMYYGEKNETKDHGNTTVNIMRKWKS